MVLLTNEALTHFETHNGIASIAQLVASGISREQVKRLQREGVIELVLQGAYRLRGQPLTELGRCTAVCIAHPGHAIAGPTAGRLLGLRRLPADLRVHTISPPHSQPTRASWVRPYRTAAIHPHDVVVRSDGIVHTAGPRTAFDLARFVSDTDLLSIIEQVMRDGPHGVEEMRAVAVDWLTPRRPWAKRYLEVLDRRLGGGAADSHPEVLVEDALAAAGVRGLVRQYPIDVPGYGSARFDLAVPDLRWAIEIDVFPTHFETQGRRRDRERDQGAHALGWSVTRLGPDDLGVNLSDTVRRLLGDYRWRRSSASA